MKRSVLLLTTATIGLAGCEVIGGLLASLSELTLLGVVPAAGFADANSPDRGQVRIAVGGANDNFVPVAPAADQLRVETEDGEQVPVETSEEVEGHEEGSFVMLVDVSGSVLGTDPDRVRVEAVKRMSEELSICGPGWEQALMEFGVYNPTNGFQHTAVRAKYTTDPAEIASAAEDLGAFDLTPLWDSTYEVLESLADQFDSSFNGANKAGMGIVVLSDGADSGSRRSRGEVADLANQLGVRIHPVGFGPAADGDAYVDVNAVEGLRRVAEATGGYYGYVDSMAGLPDLARAIAMAQCGGHTQLVVTWPDASRGPKRGRVFYKENDALAVPFQFTAQ